VNDVLFIQYNNPEDLTIVLLDLSGKNIQKSSRGSIDLSLHPRGLYLLKILERSTGKVIVERVVKK